MVFEAKFTASDHIDQDRVTQDQAASLDEHMKAGAICFVVAGFQTGEVFRVPWQVWRDMKGHFGHKHATPAELASYRVPIGRAGILLILD